MAPARVPHDLAENYPRECWYVAATSDEVGRHLLARRLLGRPVVLYRRRSGAVVAMHDRCAHRAFPLSRGTLEDDRVVCGYHGFAYDDDGRCVRVPSQPNAPYGACVPTFGVHEDPPFVWIWLGRADRAARQPPPRLPWLASDGWALSGGMLHVAANYMLLHENVLDLTHLQYVHPGISPVALRSVAPPHRVEVTERSVSYSRDLPPAPLAAWQADVTGLPRERETRQRESGRFVSPGLWTGGWEIADASDGGRAYRLAFAYAFTPDGPSGTHVFWRGGRDFAAESSAAGERMTSVFEGVFGRRKEVLEAIEANVGLEREVGEVNVVADAAALQARRIVARMLAGERGTARVGSGNRSARPPAGS